MFLLYLWFRERILSIDVLSTETPGLGALREGRVGRQPHPLREVSVLVGGRGGSFGCGQMGSTLMGSLQK